MHEGILDYRGEKYVCWSFDNWALKSEFSTVAVALWAMEENVPVHPDLELVIDGVFDGGVGEIEMNNPAYVPRSVY